MTQETEYPKLPVEFKEKWLKALRSGEYKQGGNRLHRTDDDTYCCLGVACAVVGAKEYSGKSWITKDNRINGVNKIPPALIGGYMSDNSLPVELAKMNDNGKSFLEIADWIEKNL